MIFRGKIFRAIRDLPSKRQVRKAALLFLLLFMLVAVPVLTSFNNSANWPDSSLRDLLVMLAVPVLLALLLSLALWLEMRKRTLAGFIAAIFAGLVVGGDFEGRLQGILPLLKALNPVPLSSRAFFAAALMALIIGLAVFLGRRIAAVCHNLGWSSEEIVKTLLIAVASLFLINAFQSVRIISSVWPQLVYKPENTLQSFAEPATEGAKPDIYYLVFDRYTSEAVLREQLEFDNSSFTAFLKNGGYRVEPEEFSAYPFTTISISSTLSARYHEEISRRFSDETYQSGAPFHRTVHYAPVIQELKKKGYEYHLLGSWYNTTNRAPLVDHFYQKEGAIILFNRSYTLDPFGKEVFVRSFLASIMKTNVRIGGYHIIGYQEQSDADMAKDKFKVLKSLAEDTPGGRFIFAHVITPHPPYSFNADGSISTRPKENNAGKTVRQKYLDQITYVNSELQRILSKINEKSEGKAVVILQADEGPYPSALKHDIFTGLKDIPGGGNMKKWDVSDVQMKYGIQAAYLLPGVTDEEFEKGADSTNIFRLVLNKYFGYELPYLPACSFGLEEGLEKGASLSNISPILGNNDPRCRTQASANKSE